MAFPPLFPLPISSVSLCGPVADLSPPCVLRSVQSACWAPAPEGAAGPWHPQPLRTCRTVLPVLGVALSLVTGPERVPQENEQPNPYVAAAFAVLLCAADSLLLGPPRTVCREILAAYSPARSP